MTLYSLQEVAGILRIQVAAVRALVTSGQLPAIDISLHQGGRARWRVDSEELASFIRRRTHSVTPKRKRSTTKTRTRKYF